jgi:hypothetical protein
LPSPLKTPQQAEFERVARVRVNKVEMEKPKKQ